MVCVEVDEIVNGCSPFSAPKVRSNPEAQSRALAPRTVLKKRQYL